MNGNQQFEGVSHSMLPLLFDCITESPRVFAPSLLPSLLRRVLMTRKNAVPSSGSAAAPSRRVCTWLCPLLSFIALSLALWWFVSLVWVSASVDSSLRGTLGFARGGSSNPRRIERLSQSIQAVAPFSRHSTGKPLDVGPDLTVSKQPLHVVIISISRPAGFDYLTNLLRLVQHQTRDLAGRVHVSVFDADARPDTELSKRPWLYNLSFVEVVRAPFSERHSIISAINLDPRKDPFHDPAAFIASRSKESLDYAYVLEYVDQRKAEFPYSIVLEDDSWLADDFFPRAFASIDLARSYNQNWLAFNFFHDSCFDTRKGYSNGADFVFQACTQAVMWHASEVRPLVSFLKANFAEAPIDFHIRNYQGDAGRKHPHSVDPWEIYVAIPSLVQHIGLVRSSATSVVGVKPSTSDFARGLISADDLKTFKDSFLPPKTVKCYAHDFVVGKDAIDTIGPLNLDSGADQPRVWNIGEHDRIEAGQRRGHSN